jgi:uncharacterized sulfatase
MPGINLLDDGAVRARKTIYGECFTHNAVDLEDPARNLLWRWVIDGRWKLIVPAGSSGDRRVKLYDIVSDPAETSDRASEKADIVESLHRKLDDWWKPAP